MTSTSASTAAPSHVRSRPMTTPPGTSSSASSAPAPSLTNYGFRRLERLAGNVGYLRLDEFHPATDARAASTASAVMTFLARTCALIIDLRENRGGDGSMTRTSQATCSPCPFT